jgi:hypothetical protein
MGQGRPGRNDALLAPAATRHDRRFGTCGFALDLISEPQPEPAVAEKFPEAYLDLCRNPRFLFFVLSPR